MATITHDLKSVMAQLDAKIAELEKNRNGVQGSVNERRNLATNSATLNKINARLASAYAARALLQDSCCYTQTCDYEWEA